MESSYEQAYGALNTEQKRAVDAIEGPVMVIAGPGTGKTQILTLRIANILKKTDTPPDAILALTFTEAAAANMRKRLIELIGARAYYVQISTFHGFANRLIQEHPERFPGITGSRNATEVERISALREILEKEKFEKLAPFGSPFFFVPQILSAIRHLKGENFSPEEFSKWVAEKKRELGARGDLYHEKGPYKGEMKKIYRDRMADLEKHSELARMYRLYSEALRSRKLYDFEDMLLEAVRSLEKDKDFLLELQERSQYVLVDEHQDTNSVQNRLLELLMGFFPNPNLFAVGDEKQAIYRFQGANLENFRYFLDKYPSTLQIKLGGNYRSSQTILDAAESVIKNNRATIPNPLRARSGHSEKKIELYSFSRPDAELLFLADQVRKRIGSGAKPEDMAVLFRENQEAFPIAEALERAGVPCVIESDQDILRDPDIRKLLVLFEAIEGFGRDDKLIRALHLDFLDIDPLDVYRLAEKRELRGQSIFRMLASKERLAQAGIDGPDKLNGLYSKLRDWERESRNENFLSFFEMLARDSGFLGHLLARPGSYEKISRLRALFEEAKKMVGGRSDYRLSDFIAHISVLEEHRVPIRPPRVGVPKAVRLMTAHRAKGLEFESVFLTGLTDGHWGNRRNHSGFRDLPYRSSLPLDAFEKNEDERRLFFMALTRAKIEAFLTYSLRNSDGREQVPSQFLSEIDPQFLEIFSGAEWDEKAQAEPGLAFAPRRSVSPALTDREFLGELFVKRGLTATALNNYLECPWKYFYQDLVRIPRAYNRSQAFGSAIHSALQEFFDARRSGEPAGAEFLLARFRARLAAYPLNPADLEKVRLKGEKILPLYFERYAGEWNYNTRSEARVDGVMLEGVRLHGKLDKLEFGEDSKMAVLVDYKTGKPKTRGEMEGTTKDSNGSYKRQLVFYKILLEENPEKPLKMLKAVIDFVEPNQAGKFKKEPFDISGEDVRELKKEISRAAEEIRGLKFWNERCKEKCEFCSLREMMKAP